MKLDHISHKIILSASKEAENRKHEYITPEHILYSALFYEEGSNIIYHCGGNINDLKSDLNEYFNKHIPKNKGAGPFESAGFRNVLNNTALHAMDSGQEIIGIGDILVSLYKEQDSFAAYCLEKQGIEKLDVLNYICHGISHVDENQQFKHLQNGEEFIDYYYNEKNKNKHKKKNDFLDQYTIDLTEKAKIKKLDPVICRDEIIKRTIQVLCRRIKNNPIHVGEPGIGKTAITEGLASWIVKNKVPKMLKNYKILQLDMSSVIAGTKYRGEFEERLKHLLNNIKKMKNAIIYIDEIHTIVGAGAVSGSSMDASNILKPFLTQSDLKCIGSTTYEEYKKYFDKDKALSRRFQKIEVLEPSIQDCIKILNGLKKNYEKFHEIKYSEDAIVEAVELSAKYIHDKTLPDKAIDVIDETGSFIKTYSKKNTQQNRIIGKKEIENTISIMAKIPLKHINSNEIENLKNLDIKLKKEIFGQDEAIEKLTKEIQQFRAGFNEENKPIASLLFIGPTGVGKTELSYQLAKNLGISFIRFDMSEYQEKHSISKLIGSPPGYVGYEEGGLLIDKIRLNPYSVLLLDEIEKAHPDIFNILLQIMDYATITDKTNKKANFHNVVLIMTSNAGAEEIGKNLLGFDERTINLEGMNKEIKKLFSPEFRNRLNQVIAFKQLNHKIALKVAKKALKIFENKLLHNKNIKIKISKNVYEWLIKQSNISEFGAREIYRVIEKNIKSNFVNEVLFGKLKNGGQANINIKNNNIIISVLKNDTYKINEIKKTK